MAKQHRKVQRQRRDFQHKVARQLVNRYDWIAVEELNVRGIRVTRTGSLRHQRGRSLQASSVHYAKFAIAGTPPKVVRRSATESATASRATLEVQILRNAPASSVPLGAFA